MTSCGNNFNYFPENQLTKFMYFPDRGPYAPYMSTPLQQPAVMLNCIAAVGVHRRKSVLVPVLRVYLQT